MLVNFRVLNGLLSSRSSTTGKQKWQTEIPSLLNRRCCLMDKGKTKFRVQSFTCNSALLTDCKLLGPSSASHTIQALCFHFPLKLCLELSARNRGAIRKFRSLVPSEKYYLRIEGTKLRHSTILKAEGFEGGEGFEISKKFRRF